MGSISCPVQLGPGSEDCGVIQLSRPTPSWSELTLGRPAVQPDSEPGPRGSGDSSYPGRLGPGSKLPQGRPAIPADSDPGPRGCGVDELSCSTPSRIQAYRVWTISPGPFGRVRADAGWLRCPDDMVPGPRSCGVHQLSRPTPSWSELTLGCPAVQPDSEPGPRGSGDSSYPGRLGPGSKLPQCGPVFPADSDTGPRGCGVDQLSCSTPPRVQAYLGWTISPGPFGHVRADAGSLRCPDDMVPCPRSSGVDQLSRPTRPGFELTWGQPVILANSVPGPRCRGSNGWTGRLRPVSTELWGPPAISADSIPSPN